MKMFDDPTIPWTLIRKMVDGKVSPGEQLAIDRWAGEAEERRRFLIRVRRYYSRTGTPVVDEQRIESAWQRFLLSGKKSARPSVFSKRVSGGVAAAAAVLLLIGAVLFFRYGISSKMPEGEVLIGPGEVQATLTLSDGKIVFLGKESESMPPITDLSVTLKATQEGLFYPESTASELSASGSHASLSHSLQTGRGSEFLFYLSDRTEVWLNTETVLSYPVRFTGEERRVRLSGEAFFNVAPGESPFIIEAGGMEIRVLGTSFSVSAYRDESHITTVLASGKVQLQMPGESPVELFPNQQAVFTKAGGSIVVSDAATGIYTRWHRDHFIFRDHTLQEIMRTLARWYDIEYVFEDESLEQERFYGVLYRYDEMNALLRQFERTGKVRFDYLPGRKIRIKK